MEIQNLAPWFGAVDFALGPGFKKFKYSFFVFLSVVIAEENQKLFFKIKIAIAIGI